MLYAQFGNAEKILPRTLKQLARIVIYDRIDRKPSVYANKLPLPPVLKEYVLNFEP